MTGDAMTLDRLPLLLDMLSREEPAPDIGAIEALACEMEANGRERSGPVREIFALVGDRWSTLVILVLATGSYRHAALRRTIGILASEASISQRVLTSKLRALERSGFVERSVSSDIPPRVDYRLTALGRDLHGLITAMIRWIETSSSSIRTAREAFDLRASEA